MELLFGIIITAIMYMICPFLKFIANNNYTEKQIRNVLIVNSIFVCILDNLVALLLVENYNEASILPAFIYFYINYAIWSKKATDKDNVSKKSKIKSNTTEVQTSKQKYEDLEKLKELLDKKAITEEEFEEEKKKILQ